MNRQQTDMSNSIIFWTKPEAINSAISKHKIINKQNVLSNLLICPTTLELSSNKQKTSGRETLEHMPWVFS